MLHDAQRQSFDDGTLAHTGLTNEDGVVLLAATQDLCHTLYLALTAHDGVEESCGSSLREVGAEGVQSGCPRALAVLLACGCLRGVGGAARVVQVVVLIIVIFVLVGETETGLRLLLLGDGVLHALVVHVEGIQVLARDIVRSTQESQQQVL